MSLHYFCVITLHYFFSQTCELSLFPPFQRNCLFCEESVIRTIKMTLINLYHVIS